MSGAFGMHASVLIAEIVSLQTVLVRWSHTPKRTCTHCRCRTASGLQVLSNPLQQPAPCTRIMQRKYCLDSEYDNAQHGMEQDAAC